MPLSPKLQSEPYSTRVRKRAAAGVLGRARGLGITAARGGAHLVRAVGGAAPVEAPLGLSRSPLKLISHCGDPPKSGPLVMLARGPQKGVDHGDLTLVTR